MENTAPSGSEPLSVNEAASAFETLMNDPEEVGDNQSEESQVEAQAEDVPDDDNEAAEETSQRFKFNANGNEVEVDVNELISGYQRGKDYTQKSQALAEQRKAIEAERQHLEQVKYERQAYAQKLQAMDSFLSQQNKGEDIEALKEVDPIGYAVKMAEQYQREKHLSMLHAEQNRTAQMQQAEQQQELNNHLQSESVKLARAIPDLATAKGDAIRKDIREYAKSIGWTDQELSSVYDSRAVMALYNGMRFEKLQAGKQDTLKKVLQAPKMLKSGSPSGVVSSQDKQVMQRLRQTGKIQDAAAAFERFL